LLRQLLLGSLRSPAVAPAAAEDITDSDLYLWQQAATEDMLRRAARPWPQFTGELPEPAPTAVEQPCSWRSVMHLDAMLKGHHAPALPEFIRLLRQRQRQLPPAALPQLLEEARTNVDQWQLLEPALGARGRWLAHQHPDWKELLRTIDGSSWSEEAEDKEKWRQLQAFRQQAPDTARDQLAAHWESQPVKTQARLLTALETRLSLTDEDFLYPLLAAGRKEIREAAAQLLAQLPESQYVQELQTEAATILRYQDSTWLLELPRLLPAHVKQQGISPKGRPRSPGLVRDWFTQLLARIPLRFWSDHSGQAPPRILRGWLTLPDGLALLQAAAKSLLCHPDEDWTRSLIRYWLESNNERLWQQKAAKELLEQASTKVFNDCLLPWLTQYGPLIPEDSLPAYWLSLGKHAWSPQLSRIIIEGFRDLVRERRVQQWNLYHYQRILRAAAYQSDTSLFPVLRQTWQSGSGGLGRWSVEIEKLLQTLYFRLEMAKELEKG
jgi:hypothetical protein